MNTSLPPRDEIDVEDVGYLRHGDKPLLARIYKPRGKGPFPLVIDLHGGAWNDADSPQAKQALDRITEFVHREMG